jgi:branched-chain amino acid aminotransferase
MLTFNWTHENGWTDPHIKPYGPIKIPTTATSLHYGVSCSDGFIVARNMETGQLQAKDLDRHLDRMNMASSHLDLETIDTSKLKECISELLKVDNDWIPMNGSSYVYVRLQHISMDATLGVKTAMASQFNVFLCPTTGSQPNLKVTTEGEIHKNWPRAHSDFLISSLYGPLCPTMAKAKKSGFDSVLWLVDDYIKELTYGNIFIH